MSAERKIEAVTKGRSKVPTGVTVDGVLWATLDYESHGPRGYSLQFRHVVSGESVRIDPADKYSARARVFSDSHHYRDKDRTDLLLGVAGRVEKVARELIAGGGLRDPAIVRAEIEEAALQRRKRADARIAKEREQWKERARERFANLGHTLEDAQLDIVVQLMEWSQEQ